MRSKSAERKAPDVEVVPHDDATERYALGCLLLDGQRFADVVPVLGESPTVFFKTAHQYIYETMVRLWHLGAPIDLVTLCEDLKSLDRLEAVGGVRDLYLMQESIPTAINVGWYVGLIREYWLRRELRDAGTSIVNGASDGEVSEQIERAYGLLMRLGQHGTGAALIESDTLAHSAMTRVETQYERCQSGAEEVWGIETGLPALDGLLTGLQRGQLVVLAGRPSMGKSAFAHNIALKILSRGENAVCVLSYEMDEVEIALRMLSTLSRVGLQHLHRGDLTEQQWRMVVEQNAKLEQMPLSVSYCSGQTLGQLCALARRAKLRWPNLALCVVDYLQLIRCESTRQDTREQRIAECSRSLKELAVELDVAILLLSQLNRAVESREQKRPQLADLRESGAIEQDADAVLLLYRDDYYHDDSKTPGEMEIRVAKHRNGPTGLVKMQFDAPCLRFHDT